MNNGLILVYIALLSSLFFNVTLTISRLQHQEHIKDLQNAVDEAVNDTYEDCNKTIRSQAKLNERDGCFKTVENLCGKYNKPKTCIESLYQVCNDM